MKEKGSANANRRRAGVTAIIQARMQSKRLPGKMMLDLAGRPLLAHVIERTKSIENVDTVVVATSEGEENSKIIDLAESMGVSAFVGSMDNVLERYFLAAQKYGGDLIVRVTGDNPFTDVEYADMIVDIAIESGSDYYALVNLPLGSAVEVIKREALEEAHKMSDVAYQREHVTPYIKEHPELFSIERPPVSIKSRYRDVRLTVDTPEDYKLAGILYDNLYKDGPFPLQDIFDFLEDNPDVISINNDIMQRPQSHSEK